MHGRTESIVSATFVASRSTTARTKGKYVLTAAGTCESRSASRDAASDSRTRLSRTRQSTSSKRSSPCSSWSSTLAADSRVAAVRSASRSRRCPETAAAATPETGSVPSSPPPAYMSHTTPAAYQLDPPAGTATTSSSAHSANRLPIEIQLPRNCGNRSPVTGQSMDLLPPRPSTNRTSLSTPRSETIIDAVVIRPPQE